MMITRKGGVTFLSGEDTGNLPVPIQAALIKLWGHIKQKAGDIKTGQRLVEEERFMQKCEGESEVTGVGVGDDQKTHYTRVRSSRNKEDFWKRLLKAKGWWVRRLRR